MLTQFVKGTSERPAIATVLTDDNIISASIKKESEDNTYRLRFFVHDAKMNLKMEFENVVKAKCDMSPETVKSDFIYMLFDNMKEHLDSLPHNEEIKQWYNQNIAKKSVFELFD